MSRVEQEIDILERISQILSSGLELQQVFHAAMNVLIEQLDILRATLVLWDRSTDQLQIFASVGLSSSQEQRGRYAIGEGVTGQVMASGKAAVIPDVTKSNEFLNRTGSRELELAGGKPIAFFCMPVFDGQSCAGTVNVDRFYENEAQLQADARIIKIIAGMFSQTIRIHQLVQLEKDKWLAERQQLRDNLNSKYKFDNIIGRSPVMQDVLGMIGQVASSRATVLILGETGCGKELIAKAIHFNSPRRDKSLIRVNCGALSPQLLESELFGHVKGAFTGALRDKIGRFEAADGGSIFLDEVGTLDTQLQVKLLRVLQEREFERVGDHLTRRTDVRVIAATNLDLEQEMRKGNFREDLYYRLNVVQVHLPPLRNRREDIPLLIDHFLDRYNRENQRNLRKISRDLLNTLLRYPWPGNVRELENTIERAVVLSSGDQFTEELLPLQIRLYARQQRGNTVDQSIEALAARLVEQALGEYAVHEGKVHEMVMSELERHLIRGALDFNDNIKSRTADFLGMNRNTLVKKVKELGITN